MIGCWEDKQIIQSTFLISSSSSSSTPPPFPPSHSPLPPCPLSPPSVIHHSLKVKLAHWATAAAAADHTGDVSTSTGSGGVASGNSGRSQHSRWQSNFSLTQLQVSEGNNSRNHSATSLPTWTSASSWWSLAGVDGSQPPTGGRKDCSEFCLLNRFF